MNRALVERASEGNHLLVRSSEKCLENAVNVRSCESLFYGRRYSLRIRVSRMVKCVLFEREALCLYCMKIILHKTWIRQDFKLSTTAGSRSENLGFIVTLRKVDWSLVSSAAVFWDVTQCSTQRNGCSQPNHILFLLCLWLFVVCLHFVEQTNHIIAKCEWRKISRVKASGFCFTPHARHQNWAVFVGYDHDGGKKNIWIKAPSTKASCTHCCTSGLWENICDFLEMSNCKRQSESFLQIENRIGAAFRTRCQQIERSYLISQSLYWAN